MPYTFIPDGNHAKAFGRNMKISTKNAEIICAVIRKKPLTRAKRLLNDLNAKKRSLKGKYYSNAAKEILFLLESCEKNAESAGLDTARLMVHASAHEGIKFKRRRRKSSYGSLMKNTHVELMLVEKPAKGGSQPNTGKSQSEQKPIPKIAEELEEEKRTEGSS